jgi:2-polyprenyl-6-methoxyphenol hydroxylase-like FAD-dependent oxidoreductase
VTKGHYIYAIRGRNKKPREYINLGLLPLRDNSSLRPANVITRPNHILWTLDTGREVKEWFQNSFPRLNFTSLVPEEEWDRFARAQGSRFPHCQYSNGVALSSLDRRSGVALVGDAIHSFPPDIGQGINAGLADVIALDKALQTANFPSCKKTLNSDHSLLGDALHKYECDRLKEVCTLLNFCGRSIIMISFSIILFA